MRRQDPRALPRTCERGQHAFVEEALTAALGPSETVARLTELAEAAAVSTREARASAAAMEDQIRVISDFIVDLYRAEARASDRAGPG